MHFLPCDTAVSVRSHDLVILRICFARPQEPQESDRLKTYEELLVV